MFSLVEPTLTPTGRSSRQMVGRNGGKEWWGWGMGRKQDILSVKEVGLTLSLSLLSHQHL